MNPRIVEELAARRTGLVRRVLDEMYADPFWMERYGERGRRYAEEDNGHHLDHLTQALGLQDPELFARYARWLRRVLVTRGMCSQHVAENFGRLERAIAEVLPEADRALAYLQHGRDALAYTEGPAAELQACSGALLARARAELSSLGEAPATPCADAAHDGLASLFSYWVDAVALERPELLAEHACWLQRFAEQRGLPRGDLERTLSALADALEADVERSTALQAAAGDALRQALQALGVPGALTAGEADS